MACDQIEYCGNCENYARCMKLAEEGRLSYCKKNAQERTKGENNG